MAKKFSRQGQRARKRSTITLKGMQGAQLRWSSNTAEKVDGRQGSQGGMASQATTFNEILESYQGQNNTK